MIIETNHVKTLPLQYKNFKQEIISNGKLCALNKTDLLFTITGKVKNLLVKNGSFVTKGESIASLELFQPANQF